MAVFKDQLQREVALAAPPKKIVSLVPSQTELLAELDLEKEVVGITKFCVHPRAWFKQKERVGGTKQLDLRKIRALRPDLILANKEENEKAQLETLMGEFPVWVSDIYTLDDALAMIRSVGRLTGKENRAVALNADIRRRFMELAAAGTRRPPLKAAYFIWQNPWMVAGRDTFIDDMLKRCGLQNAFGHLSRYPVIEPDKLDKETIDLILLSSEPYPFKQKHAEMLRPYFPGAEMLFVDGELFSWYGSRLLLAPAYFQSLFTR